MPPLSFEVLERVASTGKAEKARLYDKASIEVTPEHAAQFLEVRDRNPDLFAKALRNAYWTRASYENTLLVMQEYEVRRSGVEDQRRA